MKSHLISCIVPVFNGERYLAEALESILRQTYRPLQIIVADDGSTDRTAAVVDAYKSHVSYLKQSNAGPAAARNLGLSAAQGEFVSFLDADDLWHPEKLARQLARFEARPELGYCVAHVQNFWIPELLEERERLRNHQMSKPTPGYVTQTLLARRTLFETVGCFNVTLRHADDTDWFLRAGEHGAIAELMSDVLLYRRLHKTNLSREATASREEYLQLVKMALDRQRNRTDKITHSESSRERRDKP